LFVHQKYDYSPRTSSIIVGVVYDISIVLVPIIGLIIVSLSSFANISEFYQRYLLETYITLSGFSFGLDSLSSFSVGFIQCLVWLPNNNVLVIPLIF